jgi:methyl-accepting chemotaxis protein
MSTANDGMSFSKLIAVIGVLAVASVGCLLALLWVSSTVKSAYTSQQIAAGLASEFRQASDDLTRTVRLYVVTGDDRFKNEYNTIADRLDGKAARADGSKAPIIDLMKQAGYTAAELAKLDDAKRLSDDLIKIETQAMELTAKNVDDDKAKARELVHGQAYMAEIDKINKPVAEFFRMLDARTDMAIADAAQLQMGLSALMLALIGALVGTMVLANRLLLSQIGGSVDQANTAIRNFAEGDFSKPVPAENQHSMLAALESMRHALQGVVTTIVEQSAQVAKTAAELSSSASEVSGNSEKQADATSSMAASVEELSVSINHISEVSRDVTALSSTARNAASDGAAVIQKTINEMATIFSTVNSASESVKHLGEKSGEIANIVGLIKDVADQTNLLALNAAIEAARAGEQGRGFAVVADEVRKLAERSAASATEISGLVEQIGTGTRVAVDSMSAVTRNVEHGVSLTNQAVAAIADIQDGAAKVDGEISTITMAIREQAEASQNIAALVETIASRTEQSSSASASTASEAQRLTELAATMRGTVARFKV